MRFLADENFPAATVQALRNAGHDIIWVRTAAPGSSDLDVLAWTAREGRILLTFDKDFGELARSAALPAACGVVLLRIPMPRPGGVGERLADLVTARNDWAGHFSVVEPGRVRMRPLTQGPCLPVRLIPFQ
jgi:hypothetical protein